MGIQLSQDAFDRTRSVVKRVEQTASNRLSFAPNIPLGAKEFIAITSGSYSSGYSWNYVHLNDDGSLTTDSAAGSSAEMGKAYHMFGCQSIPSGTYVRMLSRRFFVLLDNGIKKKTLGSSITAGGSSGGIYNSFSQDVSSGTLVFTAIVSDKEEIISADCEA